MGSRRPRSAAFAAAGRNHPRRCRHSGALRHHPAAAEGAHAGAGLRHVRPRCGAACRRPIPLDPRLSHHHQSAHCRPRANWGNLHRATAVDHRWRLPVVFCRALVVRYAHRDGSRPAGDRAGSPGGGGHGYSDRAHVRAGLGDRPRLRRDRGHDALDLLLYFSRRGREFCSAGIRCRGARRIREHSRQSRRRRIDRACRVPRRPPARPVLQDF